MEKPSGEQSSSGSSLKWWQQLLVALSCATLLYGGRIRIISEPRVRVLEFWTLQIGLTYVAGIVLLGFAIYLFRVLASRNRWAALADHFLWLSVILSLPCLFFRNAPVAPYLFIIPFIPAMVVLGISFFQPTAGIIAKFEKGALLLSPLFFILTFQLLTYRTWGGPSEEKVYRFPARKAYPVFIFVFDEWSYQRSVQNGEFLSSLKNLRSLSRQSFFFEEAKSLGDNTWPSLDRFIYQTTDELVILGDKPYWKHKSGVVTPTTAKETLFGLARTHGYNSALVGFYIPQRQILGNQVDYVDSQRMFTEPSTFSGQVWRKLWRSLADNVKWWIESHAITTAIHRETVAALRGAEAVQKSSYRLLQEKVIYHLSTPLNEEASLQARDLVRHIEKETTAMIGALPPNSMLLSHIQIPHAPFVFDEEGRYLGTFQGLFNPVDMEGYLRQIGYLDKITEQYVAEMVASGKFDEAMIVLTSDHTYRYDPFEKSFRHVPLVVKLPHQKEAVQIKQPVTLKSLKPVFDAVMAGRLDDARAALISAGED